MGKVSQGMDRYIPFSLQFIKMLKCTKFQEIRYLDSFVTRLIDIYTFDTFCGKIPDTRRISFYPTFTLYLISLGRNIGMCQDWKQSNVHFAFLSFAVIQNFTRFETVASRRDPVYPIIIPDLELKEILGCAKFKDNLAFIPHTRRALISI